MSINTRVRDTSEVFVGDEEIQHQRHRTRRIREVTSQFDVPTSMTPTRSHLLCFHFVGCAKEVRNLINLPVVSLLDTRVGRTSAEVVPQWINLKLPTTTSREPYFRKERDLGFHGGDEFCLFIITEKARVRETEEMRRCRCYAEFLVEQVFGLLLIEKVRAK